MWRALPLVLLLAACSVTNAGEPSPPPSSAPAASRTVPPGPVLFRADQLILPPEQFPISAAVSGDASIGERAWEREFTTATSPDFRWFAVRIFILEPDVTPPDFLDDNGCGTVSWPDQKPLARELPVDSSVAASACLYTFADGERVVYYTTGFRNVGIVVGAQPRRVQVSDALASQWTAAIARQQIALIEQVIASSGSPTVVGGYEAP